MEIKELMKLKKGWDGDSATAPNKVSISNAELLIDHFNKVDIEVNYIQPSHNGGVNLIYIGNTKPIITDVKWVKIECDNDGDIGILLSDGTVWFILTEFITISESIQKVKTWLRD